MAFLNSTTAQSFRLISSNTLEVLFNIPANCLDSFKLPDSCSLLQHFYFSLQLSSHNETYSWKQVGISCASNIWIKRSPWSTDSHRGPWSVTVIFHSACNLLCIKMKGRTIGSGRTEIPAPVNLLSLMISNGHESEKETKVDFEWAEDWDFSDKR